MAHGPAEMPFLDHLEELRERLIWSAVVLLVASVAGFFLVTELDLIGVLERPARALLPGEKLRFTNPTTPIVVTFKLAFVVGIILSMPAILYHAWAFLSPALHDHERRLAVPAIWVAFVLFLAGVAMAYFLILPIGLRFLLSFQEEALIPIITVDEYLSFATRLILAFGLIFELPVVLVLLNLLGLVSPDGLRRYRGYAFVGIAALSAILTPADVGTMVMMMAPMIALYEGSIWLIRLLDKVRDGGRRGASPAGAGAGTEGAAPGKGAGRTREEGRDPTRRSSP